MFGKAISIISTETRGPMPDKIKIFYINGIKFRSMIIKNDKGSYDVFMHRFFDNQWTEESATFDLTHNQALETCDADTKEIVEWTMKEDES